MQLALSDSQAPIHRLGPDSSKAAFSASEAVIKLLRDGLDAMDGNRAMATACIQRAYALLESERVTSAAVSSQGTGRSLAPWQIRRVMSFIDANLEAPITTIALANSVQLSPHYVARAFKQSLGEVRTTTSTVVASIWRRSAC